MPDREIDEEDMETAELQVNLRKISGRSFIPSLKLGSAERVGSDGEDEPSAVKSRSVSAEEAEPELAPEPTPSPEAWRPARRSQERECRVEEREVAVEDAVTAEFQSHLRKLSTGLPAGDPAADGPGADGPPDGELMALEPEPVPAPVSRAAPGRKRTAARGGLQRSRTWQGFGSGQRYESVSDAGLPPPPPAPTAPAPAPHRR
jgi:hypothetical protein